MQVVQVDGDECLLQDAAKQAALLQRLNAVDPEAVVKRVESRKVITLSLSPFGFCPVLLPVHPFLAPQACRVNNSSFCARAGFQFASGEAVQKEYIKALVLLGRFDRTRMSDVARFTGAGVGAGVGASATPGMTASYSGGGSRGGGGFSGGPEPDLGTRKEPLLVAMAEPGLRQQVQVAHTCFHHLSPRHHVFP